MTVTVAKTATDWWLVRDGRATAIQTAATTTAELLADRAAIGATQEVSEAESVDVRDLDLLSKYRPMTVVR
ncbi:MAG: hypothetical protein WCP28_05715 [Actinomycetes bacterium]